MVIAEQTLLDLGLTKNEIKVYFALISSKNLSAREIVNQTKISRSRVYSSLDSLIQKGLIGELTKNKKKYFIAAEASSLFNLITEKQAKIKQDKEQLQAFIKKAISLRKESNPKQLVYFFEGIKGIKSSFEDILSTLQKNETIYVFVASRSSVELKNYLKDFSDRRTKKGILLKIIYYADVIELIQERKKDPLAEVRVTSKPLTGSTTTVQIYGNKTALISWAQPFSAVIIENKNISDSFKVYFNELWQKARKA